MGGAPKLERPEADIFERFLEACRHVMRGAPKLERPEADIFERSLDDVVNAISALDGTAGESREPAAVVDEPPLEVIE